MALQKMAEENDGLDNFNSALTSTETGESHIPTVCILPPSPPRPATSSHNVRLLNAPRIVDLAALGRESQRANVLGEIRAACKEMGFFEVINHGISPMVVEAALDSASDFFNLPVEKKMELMSGDVKKPVRYGTSFNHLQEQVHSRRDFLKHYSHPLSKWVHSWPSDPPHYRERMGMYAEAVQKLATELMGAIFESLGLSPTFQEGEMEDGMQVMAVNCYPPCPEPQLVLGMPPHSDYGYLTILLQNCQGLEVMGKEEKWIPVPMVEGSLLVLVGDHLEVMSNGRYKSVIHRAVVNSEKRRLSIASLHSLGIDRKVGPAPELVDKQHPIAYSESSFADFLEFLSNNDVSKGRRYIETLKMGRAQANVNGGGD